MHVGSAYSLPLQSLVWCCASDREGDAAEIGIDADLSDEQLAQLMGPGKGESLNKDLEKAAEDKVREALWGRILEFKDFSATSSFH